MRYALTALVALGCSPAAPGPLPPVDAGDVPDGALAADVGSDAGADAGDPCKGPAGSYPRIFCNGTCVRVDDANCGACGAVCTRGTACCVDGRYSQCRLNCGP